MEKKKLSKSVVDDLPLAKNGERYDVFDLDLPGFGVRVSLKTKTYFVLKRVNGKLIRVTLGRHGVLTVKDARKAAIDALGDMTKGENPNQKKREARIKGATLNEVLKDYLASRKLKPLTSKRYRQLVELYLSDWLDKPASEITKEMVQKRHIQIADGKRDRKVYDRELKTEEKDGKEVRTLKRIEKDTPNRREASADGLMRVLRAVLNFHFADAEEDGKVRVNPVTTLSRKKIWFNVDRRRSLIKNSDLPRWNKAVTSLENPHIRDFLLFLLFTGLRRNEGARLKWSQVDFQEKTFTVVDTKNKEPHTLPMSDYLHDLLKARHDNCRENEYVFPSSGEHGYLQEPKRAIDAVTAATGIFFSCHDLRRTFITIAESLDLSRYTVKALVNHKQDKGDVTAGYIVLNVERLREPMQRVTDTIVEKIKTQHGEVIELRAKEGQGEA